jgi:hypothetical protein
MLIYLDANVAQYCADYQDFVFGDSAAPSINEPLLREVRALRQIVELEQLGVCWFSGNWTTVIVGQAGQLLG